MLRQLSEMYDDASDVATPTVSGITSHAGVATTAFLANYWKNSAKSVANWSMLCQEQGNRATDLFKDDFMQYFIDDKVKAEAEKKLDKRMWLSLATRTRFFRREVADAVKHQSVTQIIILGCGFDTLAVRKNKYSKQFGVKFFEVDQRNLLDCKEAIYAQQKIEKNATYIGLDYAAGNLMAALNSNNVDFNQPTLILWEGNTFYLEKSDAIRILTELATHFIKPIITFDYLHATMLTETHQIDARASNNSLEKTLDQFKQNKSPFKTFFKPEEIIDICKKLGMECVHHKKATELAREYDVDKKPYYTGDTYSMITFTRK